MIHSTDTDLSHVLDIHTCINYFKTLMVRGRLPLLLSALLFASDSSPFCLFPLFPFPVLRERVFRLMNLPRELSTSTRMTIRSSTRTTFRCRVARSPTELKLSKPMLRGDTLSLFQMTQQFSSSNQVVFELQYQKTSCQNFITTISQRVLPT